MNNPGPFYLRHQLLVRSGLRRPRNITIALDWIRDDILHENCMLDSFIPALVDSTNGTKAVDVCDNSVLQTAPTSASAFCRERGIGLPGHTVVPAETPFRILCKFNVLLFV